MRLAQCALTLALLPLAAAPADAATRIWESGSQYVEIAARDAAAGGANRHPFKVSPETLARALARVRVAPAGPSLFRVGADDYPLLSDDATARLAVHLARAFRRARRNDDVLFRISDAQELMGAFVKRQIFTSGRAFRSGDQLNIVFGGIHTRVKKRWLLGRVDEVSNLPEPGARGKAAKLKFRVVAAEGVKQRYRKRRDWILVDLRAPRRESVAEARAAAPSVEARLKKLRRLRDDGLLTDREYRRKRRQILDDL